MERATPTESVNTLSLLHSHTETVNTLSTPLSHDQREILVYGACPHPHRDSQHSLSLSTPLSHDQREVLVRVDGACHPHSQDSVDSLCGGPRSTTRTSHWSCESGVNRDSHTTSERSWSIERVTPTESVNTLSLVHSHSGPVRESWSMERVTPTESVNTLSLLHSHTTSERS